MNIIKLIIGALGLILGIFLLLWVVGFVWSILWYLVVFGALGAVAYGGYKLFTRIEAKALGSDTQAGLGRGVDINMSWDEYERKYLKK